ncbi:hypothetical protein AA13595_0327 [Gluconacetobacter johannae DSM 13595]|uniref:Transmembrane protein n=1 Tax=Gluconacetobacter johannae TaxID=112140 RepID=A0A7W4J519_9PROT|nr:hypothetical protein [Gluconacetobacter johannae]MBB2174781.1 hypothetical protein [Gluconacetobacter johannae]GBQ80395.1 hypothetical protein AA13595_0327 [Gluconacetobacter johannae DSM 13595]
MRVRPLSFFLATLCLTGTIAATNVPAPAMARPDGHDWRGGGRGNWDHGHRGYDNRRGPGWGGGGGGYYHHGSGVGMAVGAGVAGLAVGALLGGALAAQAAPPPGAYYPPQPEPPPPPPAYYPQASYGPPPY